MHISTINSTYTNIQTTFHPRPKMNTTNNVNHLRFRCVIRAVDMTNILGALEHPERKAGQEVPSGEQSSGRAQSEPGVLLQEFTDFLQLRNAMSLKDLLLLELLEHSLVLDAGVFGDQVDDGVEHSRPGLVLRLGVRNIGYRVSVLVSESDLRDNLPAGAVLLVGEAGMVHVEIRLVLGHQVVAVVKVGGVAWEPRVFDADGVVGEQGHTVECSALTKVPDELQETLFGHVDLH